MASQCEIVLISHKNVYAASLLDHMLPHCFIHLNLQWLFPPTCIFRQVFLPGFNQLFLPLHTLLWYIGISTIFMRTKYRL